MYRYEFSGPRRVAVAAAVAMAMILGAGLHERSALGQAQGEPGAAERDPAGDGEVRAGEVRGGEVRGGDEQATQRERLTPQQRIGRDRIDRRSTFERRFDRRLERGRLGRGPESRRLEHRLDRRFDRDRFDRRQLEREPRLDRFGRERFEELGRERFEELGRERFDRRLDPQSLRERRLDRRLDLQLRERPGGRIEQRLDSMRPRGGEVGRGRTAGARGLEAPLGPHDLSGRVMDVYDVQVGGPGQRSRFVEVRTADGQRILAEVEPGRFDPPIVIDRGDYVNIIGRPTRIGDQPVLEVDQITSMGTLERERQERIRQHQPRRLDNGLRRELRQPQP